MDPTLRAGFDAALETAVNTALKYDPGTRARLAELSGEVLALELSAPRLHLFLCIEDEWVAVRHQWEGEVTTELRGSATAFLRLLRDTGVTPASLGVTVIGSSTFLAELQEILHDLDIDWEEPLAQLIGDVPAHTLGEALRSAGHWLRGQLQVAPGAAAEAVSEEWRLTPPKAQFDAFAEDLSELAMATERLEARVQRLREAFAQRGAE